MPSLSTPIDGLVKYLFEFSSSEYLTVGCRFLFGISLSDRPVWQQFIICSSGFFFGYLVNGVCEVCFQFNLIILNYVQMFLHSQIWLIVGCEHFLNFALLLFLVSFLTVWLVKMWEEKMDWSEFSAFCSKWLCGGFAVYKKS